MKAAWLLVPIGAAAACIFPEIGIDEGAGTGDTSSTTDASSSTTNTGPGGAGTTTTTTTSSTTSSAGDGGGGATTTGGGSTSDGGGGSASVTGSGGDGGATSSSNGGGGNGGDACPAECELIYPWEADGCTAYDNATCPDFTYEGQPAPTCGATTSRRACDVQGTILGSCKAVGNSVTVVAACGQ